MGNQTNTNKMAGSRATRSFYAAERGTSAQSRTRLRFLMPTQAIGLKPRQDSGTACCVEGCTCTEYDQPVNSFNCKTCGHLESQHSC